MRTPRFGSSVMIYLGLTLLLTALFIGFASVGPTAAQSGVTPTEESPVETPTEEPTDTATPVTPTEEPPDTPTPITPPPTPVPPPTATSRPPEPTQEPQPTATPTSVSRVIPRTGGGWLSLPVGTGLAALGLILLGLGLAWHRRR